MLSVHLGMVTGDWQLTAGHLKFDCQTVSTVMSSGRVISEVI